MKGYMKIPKKQNSKVKFCPLSSWNSKTSNSHVQHATLTRSTSLETRLSNNKLQAQITRQEANFILNN